MSTEPLENLEELARRAVACKHWRWMPGMRYQVGGTVGRLTDSQCKGKLPLVAETRPDLTDPATLGCLLGLIRKAWKDPQVHVVKLAYGFMGWQAWNADRDIAAKCGSEVEALVAALEVAP